MTQIWHQRRLSEISGIPTGRFCRLTSQVNILQAAKYR